MTRIVVGKDRAREKRRQDFDRMCDQIDYENRQLRNSGNGQLMEMVQDSVRDPSIKRMLSQAESGGAVRGDFAEALKSYKRSIGLAEE